MATTDLYGFREPDIQIPRSHIEGLFGLPMEIHESSYISGEEYYVLTLPGGERLSLQRNHDEDEHELAEDDFPTMPVLLYVEVQDRADELREKLARELSDFEFLQREVCTPDRRFLRIRNENGQDTVVFEQDLTRSQVAGRHA
jgi:hypothetical protein